MISEILLFVKHTESLFWCRKGQFSSEHLAQSYIKHVPSGVVSKHFGIFSVTQEVLC